VLWRGHERVVRVSRRREGAKWVRQLPETAGVAAVQRGKSSGGMAVSYGGA
jgi:hypothetical protein